MEHAHSWPCSSNVPILGTHNTTPTLVERYLALQVAECHLLRLSARRVSLPSEAVLLRFGRNVVSSIAADD
jgi:hypothetical protein